jgi:translation initiation factor IF-2
LGQKAEKQVRDVQLPETIVVSELANRMAERAADVVKSLMKMGMMVTMNQAIDADTAELVIEEFGHKAVRVSDADVEQVIDTVKDSDEDPALSRPPIVTIMGHVDHGKTSLLDAIRKANVVSGEAGGITQHIGAYQVKTPNGQLVTFLDTPGHAAFTSMRSRGAQVTDIVVLVVAADDAVMPQTVEAINHAKAAKVPMIVAINKIDKHEANPTKVRTDLLQHEVVVEAMSGDVQDVEVSAKTGQGSTTCSKPSRCRPKSSNCAPTRTGPRPGAVIEAKLDVGRGPVATVLVQNGTLRKGDIFVVGEQWGKVRALINDKGETVAEAGPSVPVEVLGLNGTPSAGDTLNVVETEAQAREIADYRDQDRQGQARRGWCCDDAGTADGQGQGRPVGGRTPDPGQGRRAGFCRGHRPGDGKDRQRRGPRPRAPFRRRCDHRHRRGSGRGFEGPDHRLQRPRQRDGTGLGQPEGRRDPLLLDHLRSGRRHQSRRVGSSQGRGARALHRLREDPGGLQGLGRRQGRGLPRHRRRRAPVGRRAPLRDNVVIHEGTLKTLKRFKDEVKEVISGQECGMAFENYEDIRQNDVIEIFEREEIQRTLE